MLYGTQVFASLPTFAKNREAAPDLRFGQT
jgi:hypothetical protein